MFEWLNQLLRRILNILPTIQLVSPDEEGIRITLGKYVTDTPPGWYFLWPVIQEWQGIKVKTQIKNLCAQSVWTLDHKELVISGAIKYHVTNARKALLDVLDYDANIQALALGVIQRSCTKCNRDVISSPNIEKDVLIALREESQGWGLRIEQVYITDIGGTRNLRLLMSSATDGEMK